MNYDITATLGPGSTRESLWKTMLAAGVTAFRLNTSHLDLPELVPWLDRIGTFFSALDPQPLLVLDLQGSKWRLGRFPAFDPACGQRIELVCAAATDRSGVLPVPHPDFFEAAQVSSGEIALNDARVYLAVETASADSIIASVTRGGTISSKKGITYTSCEYRRESLNERDREIIFQTKGLGFIRYAISYVRDAREMSGYRRALGSSAYLIAKLEREPAVTEAALIAEHAQELWLCRGDLGAELGLKAMAEAVHRFSNQVGDIPRPVHLAGQVLEHMTRCATPTRSEMCCLYDALVAGYAGVVLSDETAIGMYPLESCHSAALFRS